ncbi:MAG: hypothetical protein IJU76_14270 [Desulfovibrionaceae bacterium]|nr:hypothetical protein [Desulfovibrionaceae bacterium]
MISYAGSMSKSKFKDIGVKLADRAINKAAGYVEGQIQKGIDAVMEKIPGKLLSFLYPHEDFNRLRLLNHQLVHTDFAKEWNFSVSIAGAPADMDFYVKDVTYGFLDTNIDEEQYGSATVPWPQGRNPYKITMNMRDNEDARVQRFFIEWFGLIFPNDDGTVGLPYGDGGYMRKVSIMNLDIEGTETTIVPALDCYPTQVGDISRSRENAAFFEFPVSLVGSIL